MGEHSFFEDTISENSTFAFRIKIERILKDKDL